MTPSQGTSGAVCEDKGGMHLYLSSVSDRLMKKDARGGRTSPPCIPHERVGALPRPPYHKTDKTLND